MTVSQRPRAGLIDPRFFRVLWLLAALVSGCGQARTTKPEQAVVALYRAADRGDCAAAAAVLASGRPAALARDPTSCAGLIAELNHHPLRQVREVAPDGRLPGKQLVTVALAGTQVPRTFTVAVENRQWKVTQF